MRLKPSAHQKPSTLNPGIRELARRTRRALITKTKRKKVITVIGSVRMIRIGFTNVLRTPKTTPTIIAVRKLST